MLFISNIGDAYDPSDKENIYYAFIKQQEKEILIITSKGNPETLRGDMELLDKCNGVNFQPVVAKNKYINCYSKKTKDQQGSVEKLVGITVENPVPGVPAERVEDADPRTNVKEYFSSGLKEYKEQMEVPTGSLVTDAHVRIRYE